MRQFTSTTAFCLVGLLSFATAFSAPPPDMLVIFGTHIGGAGKGFSISHFDPLTGKLTPPKFALQTPAPAYYVFGPDGKHLYSCNSLKPAGTVSAYLVDAAKATITFINSQPTGGGDPSYISLDREAKHALVADYEGMNIAVFAINADGSLGERTASILHTGKGANPTRQNQPHPHSIRLDPSGKFALVPDLGLDKVFVYKYDAAAGTLTPNDPPFVKTADGVGPRHLVFHPNGKWAYVITEMGSTIIQFNWDSEKGVLSEVATVSALPADFKGTSVSAEIQIDAAGKYIYASNRGSDSLSVFAVDDSTGKLSLVQNVPTNGKTPRNFAIDPSGKWLIVTNHDSNNGQVFSVDMTSGKLTAVGEPFAVPYPFCERYLAVN